MRGAFIRFVPASNFRQPLAAAASEAVRAGGRLHPCRLGNPEWHPVRHQARNEMPSAGAADAIFFEVPTTCRVILRIHRTLTSQV